MPSPLPRPQRPIVLVGLMGAGKTTVGRRLARRLSLPFVDADEEIERAAGRTIAEIFAEHGEETFRDGEKRVIARLIAGGPKVLATGGGAFMNESTRALIRERAIAIWLDADTEVLAERVSRRNHRPLLKDKDPVAVLSELAERRSPLYAEAHLHVRTESGPHERTVDAILDKLRAWRP